MKRFLHNNGLSIVMFGIFSVTLLGMSISGWMSSNDDLVSHAQSEQTYLEYVGSGEFVEGVFENWESEFLQMWSLIILTTFLFQKGSSDSKSLLSRSEQDSRPRYLVRRAKNWQARVRAVGHFLYSHSLGLVMLLIFLLSFSLHAAGGAAAYNQDAKLHDQQPVSVIEYIGTSQFWYESLQNWQSEFFVVGCVLVLSIKLRERGSSQSKPVGVRYDSVTGA